MWVVFYVLSVWGGEALKARHNCRWLHAVATVSMITLGCHDWLTALSCCLAPPSLPPQPRLPLPATPAPPGPSHPRDPLRPQGYEPYLLLHRDHLPWYDERFRGYGWDKVVHTFHLANLGLEFVVHPTAFLVHVPHARAANQAITADTGHRVILGRRFHTARAAILGQMYRPTVSLPEVCT